LISWATSSFWKKFYSTALFRYYLMSGFLRAAVAKPYSIARRECATEVLQGWWQCFHIITGEFSLPIVGSEVLTAVLFLICIVGGGVQTGSTGTSATYWPIVPAPGDCEDGEFGGMNGRGSRSTRRKPAPAPLCPPQIPLDESRAWTRAAAVGSQRLTASAMARPTAVVTKTSIFWDISSCSPLADVSGSTSPPSSGDKLAASRWFLASLILRSWRWMRHVSPKHL
jgi:hypothetical protein